MRRKRTNAFTLIEAVAALAIVSIALLGLLQLHLISIRTADKAQETARAVFLAQDKMAEAMSAGFPSVGTRSGTIDSDGERFTWRTEVTDASGSVQSLAGTRLSGLRKLSIEVACGDSLREPPVRLTTYVAERKIRDL